jgi:hypothetical protein
MTGTDAVMDAKPEAAREPANNFDRLLIIKNWNGSLALIVFWVIVSFFAFGYWIPYWRFADMDIMMMHQGFLLNDGKPQDFFYHPGHLHVVLTEAWPRFLHWLGVVDVVALSKMPPASDAAAFNQVWTAAIRSMRVLSLLMALSFVAAFAFLLRQLVADWRIAIIATAFLAFSSAVMWQAIQLRTDLLSAGLNVIGLLLLLIAARSPESAWRPIVIGFAAMLCTLGIVNKVQAFFLAAAWPVVVLFFGVRSEEGPSIWRQTSRAVPVIAVLAVLVLLAAIPTAHLFEIARTARVTSFYPLLPPPFGIFGLYQALIAAYVAAAVLAFAWIWRVPALETAVTLLAVALGVMLGLLSMLVRYHPQNVLSVINIFEFMFAMATYVTPQLATGGGGLFGIDMLRKLAVGIYEQFAHVTFVLHPSSRGTMFLQWAIFAGMAMAWFRGRRLLVLQVGILMATAWLIDIAGTFRNATIAYSIFADPVIVIAAAWLFANLPELAAHRLVVPLGVLLIAAQIVMGQLESVKGAFFVRRSPEPTCAWLPGWTKGIERFPYCPPKA